MSISTNRAYWRLHCLGWDDNFQTFIFATLVAAWWRTHSMSNSWIECIRRMDFRAPFDRWWTCELDRSKSCNFFLFFFFGKVRVVLLLLRIPNLCTERCVVQCIFHCIINHCYYLWHCRRLAVWFWSWSESPLIPYHIFPHCSCVCASNAFLFWICGLSRRFILVPHLARERWTVLSDDYYCLWNIVQEADAKYNSMFDEAWQCSLPVRRSTELEKLKCKCVADWLINNNNQMWHSSRKPYHVLLMPTPCMHGKLLFAEAPRKQSPASPIRK